MIAPIELKCPTCEADPGHSCRRFLTPDTMVTVDYHHAARVDAAFNRTTMRQELEKVIESYAHSVFGGKKS